MRPVRGALLLACLCLPAAAAAQEAARPTTEPADRRVELDFQRYYTGDQLATALRALADAYPEFLRLESMGQSRGGRELWVVSVAAREGSDPQRRGAVMFVGATGADDLQGVEMALFTLYDLAQNHSRDPAVARILAETTLYVAPCLDPDRRAALLEGPADAAPAAPRVVDLDANFPVGWTPWDEGQSGPYPLSEPESRALVEFLAQHPNVAVLSTFAGREIAPSTQPRAGLDPQDLALYATVVAQAAAMDEDPGHLLAFPNLPPRAGGLLEHAVGGLGIYGFRCDVSGRVGAGLPQVKELFALARRARERTLLLADVLARLELGAPSVQRLENDVWQVDLALDNVGLLPTLNARARSRHAAPHSRIDAAGARLVAAAIAEGVAGPFVPLSGSGASLGLPDVAGGGRLFLRLVVEGAAGAVLELTVVSARGGTATRSIALE